MMIKNRRLGMILNISHCYACNACVLACKYENKLPIGIRWIRIETIGPEGVFPDIKKLFLPVLCMQCEKAPCIEACPIDGALFRYNDGVILVNEKKCDGCGLCISACPYNAISKDNSKNIVSKCNFCFNRLEKGLKPVCELACPSKAIIFGDINDAKSDVARLLIEKSSNILPSQYDLKPAIYYVNVPKAIKIKII